MIPIVPSRNSTPIRTSTTGPAIERCGRRGGIGGIGGLGGIIGLATVHLTGRRNWRNGWNRRLRRNRPSSNWQFSVEPRGRNMSFHRGASLQQFDSSKHQQNYRPGAVKAKARLVQVLQQEQAANRQKHRGAHNPPGAAALTWAARTSARKQTPIASEKPAAKYDQNHGPEAIQAEVSQA